jgi:hypothetical protein
MAPQGLHIRTPLAALFSTNQQRLCVFETAGQAMLCRLLYVTACTAAALRSSISVQQCHLQATRCVPSCAAVYVLYP